MKNISKYLTMMAAVAFAAVGCVQETPYEPGQPDVDGCYGVYFPAQEAAGSHTVTPEEPTTVEFLVARKVTTGAITVPYVFTSSADVFSAGDIVFEDGQSETTLSVDFSAAEVGVQYSCNIAISDPQYVSYYVDGATSLDYSILREKWVSLGMCKYTEDFVTTFFNAPNVTYEVEIEENAGTAGLFRLVNPYGAAYPFNEPGDWDDSKDYYMVIDASTPNMVVIKNFDSGMNWGYGNFVMWSLADYYINKGKTLKEVYQQGYTGTYENGVIIFPTSALLLAMRDYKDGAYYTSNNNGLFKVVMPGVVEVDYAIKASADLTENGVVPVYFQVGADVAAVKYAAYEGKLTATQIANSAEAIAAGTESAENLDMETLAAGLSFDASGIYTLVAVSFDEAGNAQESTSVSLTYVAAGDEENFEVALTIGIGTAEKYRDANTDNTLEIFAYGDDIVSAKLGVFSYQDIASDMAGCFAALKSVSSAVVDEINGDGYTGLVSNLLPGTEYYLLAYASNGYSEEWFMSPTSASTTGLPLPIYQNFTYKNYVDELEPASEDGFIGTWNLYATNLFGSLGIREYVGKVVISDSEIPDEGPDDYGLYDEYLTIKGLAGPYAEKYGFDDSMTFDLYAGCLYNASATTNDGNVSVYIMTEAGNCYSSIYQQYFIPVMDGYYALVTSKGNYDAGIDVKGLAFYNGGFLAAYYDYLLVDPEKDDNGLAPAESAKASQSACKIVNEVLSGVKIPYRPVEDASAITAYDSFRAVESLREPASVSFIVSETAVPAKYSKKLLKSDKELVKF